MVLGGKAVAPAIDELLDGEESDQRTRKWDRSVKGGQWRHRRHAEIAEARKKIEVAEPDHTQRRAEHDETVEGLDDAPHPSGHRLGDRRQAEVVVAPRGGSCPSEDAVDEEGHG